MTRKELLALVNAYVAEHFKPKKPTDLYAASRTSSRRESIEHRAMMKFAVPSFLTRDFNVDDIVAKNAGETFSQMLLRLVKESGEKPSTIYKRAEVLRQIYNRIVNNVNYQPSKDTAIAFAVALRLDLSATKKLLSSAGYALSNAIKRDLIISAFIENQQQLAKSKFFNLSTLNEVLHDCGQDILPKRKDDL
ncbi:MAG: hypothetical protein IJ774_03855 [Selenomonadaceae bacterium]|nr:hypothetical protein [Selenomonadaceae bacterium]